MNKSIYYLPGRSGRIISGLGSELLERGFDVIGRELADDFGRLPFGEQVALVADDLSNLYSLETSRVIANSFGAYLFLHAQVQLPPFVGKVLLLSPIVGEAINEETNMIFSPPRAGELMQLIESGTYPIPHKCEIHVGENDWQSCPANVIKIAHHLGIDVSTVLNAGHMLEKNHVRNILDTWLSR